MQNPTRPLITIYLKDNVNLEYAATLAHTLNIETSLSPDLNSDFILIWQNNTLSLQCPSHPKMTPLTIDFCNKKLQYRIQHPQRYQEYLAKAAKIRPSLLPTILDTTAGMGQDSFFFAGLGCKVTMLERNAIVAALLDNALMRALKQQKTQQIAERMHIVKVDALTYLENFFLSPTAEAHPPPDVIYIDPMFPANNKSAKANKNMQIFHDLVGKDEDVESLLLLAKKVAKKRVVLKRPKQAKTPCAEQKPDIVYTGSSTRFDIYLAKTST